MKTASQFFAGLFAAIAALGFAPSPPAWAQEQTPIIPVGSLSAYPKIVQTGTHPQLTWSVIVPEAVSDVVTINPPGTVVPGRCLIMNVRVLGASVKAVWTNGSGQVTKWEWVPTEGRINVNGSGYNRLFFDTQDNVNPNHIAHSQSVQAGDRIDFGGRYYFNNKWSSWYSSTNSSKQVIALKNGDVPPTATPLYEQPDLEAFLIPYLDEAGRIKIGARDVIYLVELTHTDVNHQGFDLQDLVLLVTFYDQVTNADGEVVDCNGNVIPPPAPSPSGDSSGGGSDDGSDGSTDSDGNDNRSGLGDGTNPGLGGGREKSPNEGTNNPNQAGDRSQ